jgi:hypothetical protein
LKTRQKLESEKTRVYACRNLDKKEFHLCTEMVERKGVMKKEGGVNMRCREHVRAKGWAEEETCQ